MSIFLSRSDELTRIRLVSVALFLFAAPAGIVTTRDAAGEDRITTRVQSFVDEGQIAGAVTLVARRGEIVHHAAVGHADIENGRPMREDSLFAIASMTKPFTAAAVMILQDEGKLSVDDPVAQYLPHFKEIHLLDGPAKNALTIRHLLTHTSGIARLPRRDTAPLTRSWELEDSVDLLGRLPLQFEPGTEWKYSGGLNVCARIVEVVSGQPDRRGLGWMCDDNRPTLTLTYPKRGQNTSLDRILIGAFDYYSGLDESSLSVAADFAVDGIAAGENLAGNFEKDSANVWQWRLAEPIAALPEGTITISIKDRQGNITRIERTFSVLEQ